MATKSTSLSTMVIFFALAFQIFAPLQLVFSYKNLVPLASSSSSPNDEQLAGLKTFVTKCSENMSRNCGKEIRNELLEIGNVSRFCCGQLVEMGLICHKAMTRLAVELLPPMFNEGETGTVVSNTLRVYNRCAGNINGIVPSPY
ncbi:hypothetical protein POM88_047109 [Heracleum sosnowskyi]|uniref:Prolamin-like domain-containing protein n=1 Tax=Heracleum sosnowskyi TaxID=360622 RepID=A0AAD8HAR9_9APIA|nr:hypothetical protein POM88_047109 [Heracleum sosnowskyi]